MKQEELKTRLGQHKMWLMDRGTGARFAAAAGENLRYADLSYANLSYANLRSADLSSADLRYANLSYANLRYAAGIKFRPLQIINTKYFITILDDHILWGCKKMTFDEVKKFEFKDCTDSSWNVDEFKLNKKIITEMIMYYRKSPTPPQG